MAEGGQILSIPVSEQYAHSQTHESSVCENVHAPKGIVSKVLHTNPAIEFIPENSNDKC